MKVSKVINNNVITCLDDDGRELVVMGKGLGFRFRPGASLDPSQAEKIFRMDTPEEVGTLKSLFSSLPPELLELCSGIIDHANTALGHRLNASIYLTLSDHVQFALTRARQGQNFANPLMTEVRVFYPGELAVGMFALERIREKFGVELPQDEAATIALHIVNAEFDSSLNATMHATQVLRPIMDIVEQWPGLELNTQHLYYDELVVHMKFLAIHAFTHETQAWASPNLVQSVREHFSVPFACSQAVTAYLSQESGNLISDTEQAYLALCIHRACIR